MRTVTPHRLLAFALTAAVTVATPRTDAAPPVVATTEDPPESRYWSAEWRKVNAVDYTWSGIMLTGLVVDLVAIEPHQPQLHWSATNSFDDSVRNKLALHSIDARRTAGNASWVILISSISYPYVIDVPVAWSRGGGDLAWQFFWQNTVVLTTASVLELGIRAIAGRARPDVTECLSSGGDDSCLYEKGTTQAFPNGHVAIGSAMAALTCVQHLETDLYGGPWDAVTCATAITANVTLAALRMMADKHWATDTIAGGVLGAATGVLLPELLYYHGRKPSRSDSAKRTMPTVFPMPFVSNGGGGLGLTGLL